jgi:hypothetical protein
VATVYGIVKHSGGFIWVYSQPGMGTTSRSTSPDCSAPPQPNPCSRNLQCRAEPSRHGNDLASWKMKVPFDSPHSNSSRSAAIR